MRLLWVVNLVVPQVSHLISDEKVVFGGWVSAMLTQLSTVPDIQLAVAIRAPVDMLLTENIDGVKYYLLPINKADKFDVEQSDCQSVLKDFNPDILHVEGSESAHARRFLGSWNGRNVLSMQGIINAYEPYEYGGLSIGKMWASLSPIQILVATSMFFSKMLLFKPRLSIEKDTISKAKNILGRTTWDRAHSYAINKNAPYFSCNRILRDTFYERSWDINNIQRHSIFIGNAAQPRKGAHFVLQAIAQLRCEFPDIKLSIAGESPEFSSWKNWKKIVGYPAYLRGLIEKLELQDVVQFTGVLKASDLARKLQKSHVYVLSSVIENSPNTLGEAMIMGVPSVAAYVGGVSDMASENKEALFYRDNDPQLLAFQIKKLFDDDDLARKLSEAARLKARITHDPQDNLNKMCFAYKAIMDQS